MKSPKFSLRSLLLLCLVVALGLSACLLFLKLRYGDFKTLQTDGAIVRMKSPPAGTRPEFAMPQDVAFFPVPNDSGVRLGDTQYSIDDAEVQLLAWKEVANKNGVDNVQLWVVTDVASDPKSRRLLTFGIENFTAAGVESPDRYNRRWTETMKLFK